MERKKLILVSLLVTGLLGIGFMLGAAYVAMRIDEAHFLDLIAQLKRQDAVMRLLRQQQFELASEAQGKYLSATIYQLQLAERRLPKDVMQLIDENKERKVQSLK